MKKCTTPRLPAWLHARILARDGRCPMHPVGVRATRRGGARVLSVPVTSTLLYFPVCRLHSILNILQTLRFEYAFSGFTRHSAPSASPRGPRVSLWPGLSHTVPCPRSPFVFLLSLASSGRVAGMSRSRGGFGTSSLTPTQELTDTMQGERSA